MICKKYEMKTMLFGNRYNLHFLAFSFLCFRIVVFFVVLVVQVVGNNGFKLLVDQLLVFCWLKRPIPINTFVHFLLGVSFQFVVFLDLKR